MVPPAQHSAFDGTITGATFLVENYTMDGDGNMPLLRAGQSAAMNLLSQDEVDKTSKAPSDEMVSLLAALERREETVKQVLGWDGIDVNRRDSNHRTPLSYAAEGGDEAVVKLLLGKDNIDVNSRDLNRRTPLSLAAGGGHEAVVRLLLEMDNIDVNSKDSYYRTPLSFAAEGGQEAVMKLLLGRDDVLVNFTDSNGCSPLSYAVSRQHEAVIKILLARGAVHADSSQKFSSTNTLVGKSSKQPMSRFAQKLKGLRVLLPGSLKKPEFKSRFNSIPEQSRPWAHPSPPSSSGSSATLAAASSPSFRSLSSFRGSSTLSQMSADEMGALGGAMGAPVPELTRMAGRRSTFSLLPLQTPLNVADVVPPPPQVAAASTDTGGGGTLADFVDHFRTLVSRVQSDTDSEEEMRMDSLTSHHSSITSTETHGAGPTSSSSSYQPTYPVDDRINNPLLGRHIRVLGGYVHRMPTVESVSSYDTQQSPTASSTRGARSLTSLHSACSSPSPSIVPIVE